MAVTILKNFKDVQGFINQVLAQNNNSNLPARSPHKAFWSTMTFEQFVNGNVPNVTDDNGNPIPILIKGDSAKSNIILALSGKGIFSPDDIGIMPPPNPGTPSPRTSAIDRELDRCRMPQ